MINFNNIINILYISSFFVKLKLYDNFDIGVYYVQKS